jgi:hypothetical protein
MSGDEVDDDDIVERLGKISQSRVLHGTSAKQG